MSGRLARLHREAFVARLAGVLVAAICLVSCTTTKSASATYGAQPQHLGYVPAAIALQPCRAWPAGARFVALPLTTAKDAEVAELCASFDKFVLEGFSGQPYMRGYTPKFIARALADAGRTPLEGEQTEHWQHQTDDCADCASSPAFYAASIAKRPEWQRWLLDLSKSAKNVDAVLLPFVTYAHEKRYADRGLQVAERGIGATLLLVDTATGDLLWAGGREAVVPAKRLDRAGASAVPLEPPPWSEALSRLLTEDLWREFPGRQIY